MKKKLLSLLTLSFCGTLLAQDYIPFQVSSGFNADVIANGVGPSLLSTNSAFDNANYALIAADFQATSGDLPASFALPISGVINNNAMPGLSFQLAAYASDNALRLAEQNDFGVFSISNGAPATTVYILAATGSGSGTFSGTIQFSDNSTQSISGTIPDWFFSNALPVVTSGFGRVNLDNDIVESPETDPRLYQYAIDILPGNQTKTITGIDFTKTSFEEGVINIFAVSAQLLGSCPAPTQLVTSNLSDSTAVVSWTEPAVIPNLGYEYFLSPDNTIPTAETVATGTSDVNSVALDDLGAGINYCVYVRAVCSETEVGPWSSATCFTPGQIEVTDPNDIPTLFTIDEVDVNSTTSCPGTLTVNVPAGYIITSVATSYDMQTAGNGWMSEQRSILVCTTNGNTETAVTAGDGNFTGTYDYERTGLGLADGLTGAVNFELRAWRTYGSGDCNIDYNRVVGGTWTVTVTVTPTLAAPNFTAADFSVYPNPATEVLNISGDEMIADVRLFNLLGQEVLQQNGLNAKQMQIPTTGLSSGKYILKITSEGGTQSKGIVKR